MLIASGQHERTLFLVHPVADQSHGYFALVDDVVADNPADSMRVNLHPNTATGVRTDAARMHYSAAIDGFNQYEYDGSEGVSIFYGTVPSSVSIKKAYKGDFDFDAMHSDYLEAEYPTDSSGRARAATVVFSVRSITPATRIVSR